MKKSDFRPVCAAVCLSTSFLSFSAISAPISMAVDPTRSTIDMAITVDITLASDTDMDSSTLSGTIEIELDDAGNPTQITLNDLMVVIDQTMNFNWSFGFFGSANAVMTNGSVAYATRDMPTGPVPITAGSFLFPGVLFDIGGVLNVNYDIFLGGSGTEVVNMADQGPIVSDFWGDVVVVGELVTLTTTLPLNTTQPLFDPNGSQIGTVTTTGTATIVATGTAPSCPADMTGDGQLNFFDVSAFLGAFSAMDPAADFTSDGQFNFFDVSAFLTAFANGCP